jgi:glycyl-tRNA synthetase
MVPRTHFDIITEIAKRRGFYWPSFEIYGGLSGFTTYGDLGTKIKRNIKNIWREHFIRRQGFLELDSPIINPKRVFEASGHLDNFKEYSVECSKCIKSFRADHLIERKTGLENVEALGEEAIKELLLDQKIMCPECGGQLKDPTLILTMFKTEIGATGGEVGYARPETAQAMFLNFRRGFQHAREKLPFALAQASKVMRNEISPRRGILRLREFTIMELELFFDPFEPKCPWLEEFASETIQLYTEKMELERANEPLVLTIREAVEKGFILTEWQGYFMGVSQKFIHLLGVPKDRQRFRAHLEKERAHYSAQTYDHEVMLKTLGWLEVCGIAYRTDFDLKNHMEVSGLDMTTLKQDGTRVVPHVVEPSYGLERLLYVTLENSYERKNKRNILHLPKQLAPYQIGVFPLVTKDELPKKAAEVRDILQDAGFWILYDESGSIGRRYARSDEVGTPLAIAVDYDTRDFNVLTIRNRDDWEQISLKLSNLVERLEKYFKGELEFSELGEKVVKK